MSTPFPFEPLVAFGFLSTMLIAGVLFRATIPIFQKILFPASLIGGLLGLFFINFDYISIKTEMVKAFEYHFFNIPFIPVGLAFATIGFFFAFFVGVPLANVRLKKEKYRVEKPPLFLTTGILQKGERPGSAGGVTIHNSNLDTLTFHFSQVGLVYMVTYFFLIFVSGLLPPGTANMIWGFFFIFGLIFAILLRLLINISPFSHLLDAPLQRRITGFSVDYLIVSTGCAIELLILETYIAPILFISVTGGVITTIIVFTLGRKLPDYGLERSIAIYGVVTGTVSSGLMLLRIVDPEFKTPVAREIGFMNIFAVPVVGGLTCLINAPLWWGWSLLWTCLVFLLILTVASVILLRKKF